MGEPDATWVYAVVAAGAAAPTGGAVGVADEPVRRLEHAEVAALVGSVDRRELGEASLLDPRRLERTARRHHQVVSTVFGRTPTVPFRLATIYHDDDRVADLLRRRRDELRELLARVSGREEWGLRAYAEATPETEPATPTDPARPGTGYLLRRRTERARQEESRQRTWESAHAVHTALSGLAAAATCRVPSGTHGPDPYGSPVLDGAYLIDEKARDDLTELAGALAGRHPDLRLRMTGPWPAYSFVEVGPQCP